ncbi:HlyD family secretion protein [Mesobacterium sp. TK19101]|uniref:HlyD family secretion protein n=1 Tax=Mesobacterium hydrothermale TaxID=3111907 RepID=A0ABU6HHP0_9RHOB|nr:HlyD family secretion protein [Mesobacterium sp. TK19101]MEC3860645.1 HlyD family secretion protein [Mesobacterium sp. TK19101]
MSRLKLLLIGSLVVAIAGGLWGYWKYTSVYPSTRDAYVQAHIVSVAAEITGKVAAVHVGDNAHVAKGDPLFDIDDTTYQSAVKQAQAQVDSARAAITANQSEIDAAQAGVASAQSARQAAEAQLARIQTLFERGNAPKSTLDDTRSAAASAKAAVNSELAALTRARAALTSSRDALAVAEATLAIAQTNLARTHVTAPADGWVTNLDLRIGSPVTAYRPLFAVVDDSDWWIEANFKETDLPRIREGQPVKVAVDLLPGQTLTGTVASLARGSGSTFALLPAENASGNWVKVTQRFAVRIALDPSDADLRVGASATATIDTTGSAQ